MNYPVAYSVIPAEEMTYLYGGEDFKGLFDYMMGDYLRDTVKSDLRSAVWNSAKKGSFTPIVDWYKTASNMSLFGMAGYVYGFYHLWEAVKKYVE